MSDDSHATPALDRLRGQVLQRWRAYPDELRAALDELLAAALQRAAQAEAKLLVVMNPVSRPQRLRLGLVASENEIDAFYHQDWAELACSDDGVLYLIYRHSGGGGEGDYAISWAPSTSLPSSLQNALPEALALALLGGDAS
jgi:hypothetical protein